MGPEVESRRWHTCLILFEVQFYHWLQMLTVLNPSNNYRQQFYFTCEGDTYLDTLSVLCAFHLDSSLADVKVAPQNAGAGAASVCCAGSKEPALAREELQRNCALAFFKRRLLRVCTHKLSLKILLAYCLRWVLETITSARIPLGISIALSGSPAAGSRARPLWRVDNACHLPPSTQLPASKPAALTSASPPLISIHTPAY